MNFILLALASIRKSWKQTLLVPAIFIFMALIARTIVFSSDNYPVQFHDEVVKPGYETQPAYYEVYVSPKQSWEITHSTFGGKLTSTLADVFFWCAIVLMILGAIDLLNIRKPLIPILLCLVLWISFKYGAHSKGLGNYVRVSPEEYQKAKDSPEGLGVFFYGKHLY